MKDFKSVSICVTTYILLCFLVFSTWLIFISQYSTLDGPDLSGKMMYILNAFFIYVLMAPFDAFFDSSLTMVREVANSSEQMTRFYNEIPILWIYGISALLCFSIYTLFNRMSIRQRKAR
ncbi:hypothetical protein [Citrobacter sp. S-77]|uniref:hypothetical protein n=1 Tax=Citrobacter sp. S-77 TaxID=1080067 RepID=UPI0005EFF002|nr:hypothetical protein [Citrobacter sp. S-77]